MTNIEMKEALRMMSDAEHGFSPEFREEKGRFYSQRADVRMEVTDSELVVRTHYLRGADEVRVPLADVKAVTYGFGCDYMIEKADGTVECLG